MWKAYNINASRHSEIMNFCTHPFDKKKKLYFYADLSHAFKNTKAGFLNNKIITIPDKFCEKYSLPSNVANSEHLKTYLTRTKILI